MIAALTGALGTTLIDLTIQVTDDLRRQPVADQLVADQPVANQQVVDLFRASSPVMLSLAA
jgi:hypothetical protein